jgi:enoyl-CoA hydratase
MDKMYRWVNFDATVMSMGEPHLLSDVAGSTARLTLNRADRRNAPSPEMIVRLAAEWDQVASDPSVRVVALAGC